MEVLNYEIIRQIGEGGMGKVFLARNKSIHQFVAIKMVHPQFGNIPELRERFRQEAIMLSSMNHPNIVKFLNYVENEIGVFLIMEYVDGMTLEDYIGKKSGLIVEDRAIPLMNQILDAFSYAHGRGIVHRDIKPSNILITNDGNIKILDFGIAKIMSDTTEMESRPAGTPSFMSPEQATAKPLDIRSDIYSLGVVFHNMLTGQPPYDVNSLTAFDIITKIVNEPLPRMKEVYPYISDHMQSLVDKTTAKKPEERYRNCKDIKQELMLISMEATKRKKSEQMSSEADAPAAKGRKPKNNKPAKRPKSPYGKKSGSKWWIAALCVLAVIGIGFGFMYWWTRNGSSVKYYADYVDEWGIPVGIKEISAEDRASMPMTYRIVRENGKVTSVILMNANDSIMEYPDSLKIPVKFANVRFEYTPEGRLLKRIVYDASGLTEMELTYTEDLKQAEIFYPKADTIVDSLATIPRDIVKISRLENGRVDHIAKVDANGNPKGGADSVCGYIFEYDNLGRVRKLTCADASGTMRTNDMGVMHILYTFGENGLVEKVENFDMNGKPVVPQKQSTLQPMGKKSKKSSKKKYVNHYDNGTTADYRGNDKAKKVGATPKKEVSKDHNSNYSSYKMDDAMIKSK